MPLFKEYLRNTNQTFVLELPFGFQHFPGSGESLRNPGQPRKPSQARWNASLQKVVSGPLEGGWH